jgi:hypothetical protein
MFFRDRGETLAGLAQLGGSLCGYTWDPADWLGVRCDCKYGGPVLSTPGRPPRLSERTGCPELRSVYKVVAALTDQEWKDLLTRAGGITTGDLADALREHLADA